MMILLCFKGVLKRNLLRIFECIIDFRAISYIGNVRECDGIDRM